jgi:hypothetical protein
MKRILSTTAFLATLACTNLSAQTVKLSANIPFDFQSGNALMPAGEYIFYHSGDVLTIRPLKGGQGMMILTRPAWRRDASGQGEVQFQRYGDAYFLSGLWTANSQDGLAVSKSTKEKELARRVRMPESAAVALSKH